MDRRIFLKLGGREYVVMPRLEYERLARMSRVAGLPPLPNANADGNFPAVKYARASIAREIVCRSVRAGLSQNELARRAGVHSETLCRIETGKHTASTATVAKLDRALSQVEKGRARRRA